MQGEFKMQNLDFENECKEFTEQNLVKSIVLMEKTEIITKLEIKTLDDKEIKVECSICKGIKVVSCNPHQDGLQTVFESFNQLLSVYSPEYNKKFQSELFNELLKLQQEQNNM